MTCARFSPAPPEQSAAVPSPPTMSRPRRAISGRPPEPLPGARLSHPAESELVQGVAEGVHRWLDEVVADCLYRLGLGGLDQRTGDLRDMCRLVERDVLGLGVEHRLGELGPQDQAAAEPG